MKNPRHFSHSLKPGEYLADYDGFKIPVTYSPPGRVGTHLWHFSKFPHEYSAHPIVHASLVESVLRGDLLGFVLASLPPSAAQEILANCRSNNIHVPPSVEARLRALSLR